MHARNKKWWEYCRETYPQYFNNRDNRIIEFGSAYVNGSIRDYVGAYKTYVGVDWRPAKNVDLVCFAHEVNIPELFQVVLSASMLEHDIYWEKSIENMVHHLAIDGILIISWGAALNQEHCSYHAPDGKFHALKANLVIEKLRSLGLYIQEFHYEKSLFPEITDKRTGNGEVVLVAFKDKKFSKRAPNLDQLLIEDQ